MDRRTHRPGPIACLVLALVAPIAILTYAGPAAADGNEAPGAPEVFRSITAGGSHTCAILEAGDVKCWGQNDRGQLGLGDTSTRGDQTGEMGGDLPVVDLGTGRTATAISAGHAHTCALLDDGSVKCWGENFEGALGIGETGDRGDQPGEMGDDLPAVDLGTGRTATAISTGTFHTCAILDNATVKCWGFNQDGQLGLGTGERGIGDQPGDMGNSLLPVDLGGGGQPDAATPVAVSAGGEHTCVLFASASVKCWGSDHYGQLGRGDDQTLGDQPNEMGTQLPFVPVGGAVTAISAGVQHTCALLGNLTVKCWGRNEFGQLGQGDTENRGDNPGEMAASLHRIELGTGRVPDAVSSGGSHSCVLMTDGSVTCWGRGTYGQLGSGSPEHLGDGPTELGDDLPRVDLGTGRSAIAVTTGDQHSCAVLDDLTLKCWGFNGQGQLGLGDTSSRGDGPEEMGDDLPAVGVDPVFGLAVTLTADQTQVFTGQVIQYHLTLTNTGNTTLTGVDVTDPLVAGCDGPVADLAPGASRAIDCGYVTTTSQVGTLSHTAVADTNETEPVTSNQVDVAVVYDRQPDLTLKRARAPRVGDDLYGSDPASPDQTVSVGRERNGRVTFYAVIGNDGDVPGFFTLRRIDTDPGLRARYLDETSERDVTSEVLARTYRTPLINPGSGARIRVEVTVTATARRGVLHHLLLRAKSLDTPSQLDTVRGSVSVH